MDAGRTVEQLCCKYKVDYSEEKSLRRIELGHFQLTFDVWFRKSHLISVWRLELAVIATGI